MNFSQIISCKKNLLHILTTECSQSTLYVPCIVTNVLLTSVCFLRLIFAGITCHHGSYSSSICELIARNPSVYTCMDSSMIGCTEIKLSQPIINVYSSYKITHLSKREIIWPNGYLRSEIGTNSGFPYVYICICKIARLAIILSDTASHAHVICQIKLFCSNSLNIMVLLVNGIYSI